MFALTFSRNGVSAIRHNHRTLHKRGLGTGKEDYHVCNFLGASFSADRGPEYGWAIVQDVAGKRRARHTCQLRTFDGQLDYILCYAWNDAVDTNIKRRALSHVSIVHVPKWEELHTSTASALVICITAAFEEAYGALFSISNSPIYKSGKELTFSRRWNNRKATRKIHNSASGCRSPVMSWQRLLCLHLLGLLSAAEPQATVIDSHDIVKFRGFNFRRGHVWTINT